jgi:hypothetical protein
LTVLKLHDDGWLKLPARLQRALGAATGDLLEVVPGEDGLVLRRRSATPASAETIPATPALAPVVQPAPVTQPVAEIPAPRQRGRPRKVVADAPAAEPSPPAAPRASPDKPAAKTPSAGSVALPPTLRAVGRRKPRAVQPPV